jgi:hypothetical protein
MSTHNWKKKFPFGPSVFIFWSERFSKLTGHRWWWWWGNVVWPEISMDLLVRALESGRAP